MNKSILSILLAVSLGFSGSQLCASKIETKEASLTKKEQAFLAPSLNLKKLAKQLHKLGLLKGKLAILIKCATDNNLPCELLAKCLSYLKYFEYQSGQQKIYDKLIQVVWSFGPEKKDSSGCYSSMKRKLSVMQKVDAYHQGFVVFCKFQHEFSNDFFKQAVIIFDLLEVDLNSDGNLLYDIASSGNLQRAKALLELGVNVNQKRKGARLNTPLSVAMSKNNIPMIELLLGYGAELDLRFLAKYNHVSPEIKIYVQKQFALLHGQTDAYKERNLGVDEDPISFCSLQ